MRRLATCLALAYALVTGPAVAQGAQASSAKTSASTTPKVHKRVSKKHHSRYLPTQKAPTADRISEIQSALAREGYYQGDLNGKMDSNTIAALQKFQSANGIEGNGKLDAPTLQKLGLGSDIAGVSAPKPVVPASTSPVPPVAPPESSAPAPAVESSVNTANGGASTSSPSTTPTHP